MRLPKKVLSSIPKCYAALGYLEDGEPKLAFAGEGKGVLQIYSGADFSQAETVWEDGGGTMSMIALEDGRILLVSRGFYSMVESAGSTIYIVRHAGNGYTYEPIASLPFLHRFGVLEAFGGRRYVVASTIATQKESKEDWSKPGHVYIAPLPADMGKTFTLTWEKLPGAYTKNHGFCIANYRGRQSAYICCEEGIYVCLPPQADGKTWSVRHLVDMPVSDVAVMDIDGDGEDELAVITPFHGDKFAILHRDGDVYREIYAYSAAQGFYHAIYAAELCGQRAFIGGARRGAQQLFLITYQNGQYVAKVIDENVGPSNVAVLNTPAWDILLSANRQVDEAAIYLWNKEP